MDKEKKNNGKRKLVITMAVALILLVGITVSYGYIAILGNSKNQEVSVGTGDIHLELDDADSGSIEANLNLGQSITKTLKITNKGTKPGKVQINWKNLVNTYNSRSLSYTLETSNNKTSGYTRVETIRDNVPVSTEAKEVPLSKEITIPVQSAPIYYRVTITFNNLSDVDQSGDVNATLTTQFSLSEPENLSKKVIAILDGNVKTSDINIINASPQKFYGVGHGARRIDSITEDDISSGYEYVVYSDKYEVVGSGETIKFKLINPQYGKYTEVYSFLAGKYVNTDEYFTTEKGAINTVNKNSELTTIMEIASATATSLKYQELVVDYKWVNNDFKSASSPASMTNKQDNYITYADTYKFEEYGGYFILENPQTCKWSECYQNLVGKYIMSYNGSTSSEVSYANTAAQMVRRIDNTDKNNMYYSTSSRAQSNDLDHTADGIFKTEDDYGDSYFYRGAVKNNNVKFAGKDWKILRVNGDGSIRMIYSGTNGDGKFSVNSDTALFNLRHDDIKYAGYMFGGSTEDAASTSVDDAFENKYSSNAKKIVDEWYENNLTSYTGYISDTLFCNDREISSTSSTESITEFMIKERGFASGNFRYSTLKCAQKNDRFTVDDEKIGNGALTYPVGLITADEVLHAGVGVYDSSISWDYEHYLGYGGLITMTPIHYKTGTDGAAMTLIHWSVTMYLDAYTNSYSGFLSPVINIKPEYALQMIGSGTSTDPFIIPGVE